MAESDTRIANEALIALGAKPVTDLYDSTDPNARVMAELFDLVRDELLMFHDWQFATKVVRLAEDPDDENLTRYEHSYHLPADLLRMVTIVDGAVYADMQYQHFLMRGNRLYCDLSPCAIRYVARVEDVTEFPRWFDRALAMNLAARAAVRIAENPQKAGMLKQEFGAAAAEALRMDAFSSRAWERPSQRIEDVG